jgi:hypothetical protein
MFKTIVIAALGFAAVSAQFLDERNLQNTTANSTTTTTTTTTAAAPTSVSQTAFTAAPAVAATTKAETGCNTAGYAIFTNTRAGVAVAATVPALLCVPTDFINSTIGIAGSNYTFTAIASNVVAPARIACTSNADCTTAGSCCADVTLTAGPATGFGTATKKFCTAGAALTLGNSTYVAASWLAGYTATVRTAACTPTAPTAESFGSYIKASVMVVVAVLSVALF